MEYEQVWKKVLRADEVVKHEFSIGKRYRTFNMIVWGLVALLFMTGSIGFGVFLFLLVLFYFGFYLRVANAYALTDKRILIHRGWLSTSAVSVEYTNITDVTIQEPFIERLLTKTGNLLINTAGTGAKEVTLTHITAPYEVRKKIDEIRSLANSL
jgi:uncharacterized membrane protein YdbT with pleckstrin-like domain